MLARLDTHLPADFGLAVLFYGAYKSQRVAGESSAHRGLQFEVVPFDTEDARHAGEIRAQLAAAGAPIGPYDVLIAGQARRATWFS